MTFYSNKFTHINGTQFSDMTYDIDITKLLKLVNTIKSYFPTSVGKIVIDDIDDNDISIIIFKQESIGNTRFKIKKKIYSFNSSIHRWAVYELLSNQFYIKLENILTDFSKKMLIQNHIIHKHYETQMQENEENVCDIFDIESDDNDDDSGEETELEPVYENNLNI
jgi:hypothetical protein